MRIPGPFTRLGWLLIALVVIIALILALILVLIVLNSIHPTQPVSAAAPDVLRQLL